MQRPWTAPGIGWVFAVLVLIAVILMVLHVFAASEIIVLLLIGALALALLL